MLMRADFCSGFAAAEQTPVGPEAAARASASLRSLLRKRGVRIGITSDSDQLLVASC